MEELAYLWEQWLLYKDSSPLNTDLKKRSFLSLEKCIWKFRLETRSSGTNRSAKPRTTLCQPSSQPDTRAFTALTSEESQLDWGWNNKPLPKLHTAPQQPQLEGKPDGWVWTGKKESLCQAASHILIVTDKEVGVSGDVCERVGHVTQQTCLPECAKQFSTWVSTVKPQDPNQLLSHQRLKPCSHPSISEMLC